MVGKPDNSFKELETILGNSSGVRPVGVPSLPRSAKEERGDCDYVSLNILKF
jgi:hypothetical protein